MGTFQRLGSVSRLPIIGGDKVVCMIGFRVSEYDGTSSFIPLHLPIRGLYDDYGSLFDIDENPITETLCKLFECNDIERIIKEVHCREVGVELINGSEISLDKIYPYTVNFPNELNWELGLFMEHASYYDRLSSIQLHVGHCAFNLVLDDTVLTEYFRFEVSSEVPCLYKRGKLVVVEVPKKNRSLYYLLDEDSNPHEVYWLRSLVDEAKKLFGYELTTNRGTTHTRYGYDLLLGELRRIQCENDEFKNDEDAFIDFIGRCLNGFPIYVEEITDKVELLRKNNFFNSLRDLMEDIFDGDDLLMLKVMSDGGDKKMMYEGFFKSIFEMSSSSMTVENPYYYNEFTAYKEFTKVIYKLGLKLEPSLIGGQDICRNTMEYMKGMEMSYLKYNFF